MSDPEEIRKVWIEKLPLYQQFGDALRLQAAAALAGLGLWHKLSGPRLKSLDSLIKKVIKKPTHTFEDIHDKVGLRVVLRFDDELDTARSCIESAVRCIKSEDVTARLGTSLVGYQGIHLDVGLPETVPNAVKFAECTAEIQIRTLAQDLWAEMAHELSYKNMIDAGPGVERRINILSGLTEFAGMEFTRINKDLNELPSSPEVRILHILEKQYFKVTGDRYDSELSIEVIKALLPLYGEPTNFEQLFEAFTTANLPLLRQLYEEQRSSISRSVFFSQPESLMILHLLERDQYRLREKWTSRFSDRELERIAAVWHPLD